jgi:DNA mismatch repair protein MSH6
VEPKPGADAAVDAADDRLAAADDALNEWLVDARKEIGGSKTEVVFVSVNKVGAAQVESSLPMA